MGLLLILLFIIGFALAAYAVTAVLDDKDQSIVAWGVFLLALTSTFFVFLPDLQRRVAPSDDYTYSSPFVAGFPLKAVAVEELSCCSNAEAYYFVPLPTIIDWMIFLMAGLGLTILVGTVIPFTNRHRVMIACSVLLLGFTGFIFLISKDDDYSVISSGRLDVEQACLNDNDCWRGHKRGKGG